MKRRAFIAGAAGAAAARPLRALAQQQPKPVVGYLFPGVPGTAIANANLADFKKGLQEKGFVDGESVEIAVRSAQGHYDRLPGLMADLVQRKVAVIAALGTPAALAAKAGTQTVPVVFETAGDPVALGLVPSLARPGGNITGVTQLTSELVAKRMGLLHDLVPGAKTVGFMVNPKDARAETQTRDVQGAAKTLGLPVKIVEAASEAEIETGFAELARAEAGGLILGTSEFFTRQAAQITGLATKHRIPAIYQYRLFVEAGGLMSYGASLATSYRLAGVYTARILKGEKPADLPVLQPSEFELVLNLKAAAAIGLNVPREFVLHADEVIE